MDAQRFDDLERALGRRTSRRTVLRGAAGATAAGVLVRAGMQPSAAQEACGEGLTDCNGVCVDLSTDMNNCGACGAVCESGLVGVACYQGECVRTSCPAALTGCPSDNPNPSFEFHCFDLTSDPNHCGACDNVCASGVCVDGVCSQDVASPVPGLPPANPTAESLPSTGSGSAVSGKGDGWVAAALATAAVVGAAALRKLLPHRAMDDK